MFVYLLTAYLLCGKTFPLIWRITGFASAFVVTVTVLVKIPWEAALYVAEMIEFLPGRIGSAEYFKLVHPHEALAELMISGSFPALVNVN